VTVDPLYSPRDKLFDRRGSPLEPALIRSASAADVVAIAEFQTRCWRDAYAGLVPQAYLARVGVPEREARWLDRITTGSRDVALAELDGRVVGVVSWGTTPLPGAPARELKSLYVASAEQRRGLGGQLLRRAVGEEPAHLWVFEDNMRAQAFYRRHAFGPGGRRGVDADTGLTELLYTRF
jgi:ribosomal protein S18 acetylase RimI-like enzyme